MPVQCVTCGLLFRSRNELEWHMREEHTRPSLPAGTPAAKNATAPADDPTAAAADEPDQGPDPPPSQARPEPGMARGFMAGPFRWLRNRLRPPAGGRQLR